MTRTDKDSWDLASSVGATATICAAARALASRKPDPLINDPFADPLVRAVGIDFFIRQLDGEIDGAGADADPEFNLQRLTDVMAVRTRFFDDFFHDATTKGIRQVVILAAGRDSRPYRLSWPSGTVLYEVDQPEVIEFKSATLAKLGGEPTAELRPVPIDLRNDWPNALRRCGFNGNQPTAWSAEGLLLYLPPDAQNRLFDDITDLSAPGSRLATEEQPDAHPMLDKRANAMFSSWAKFGFEVDFSALVYRGDRTSVTGDLAARGWQVSTRTRSELFADAGLAVPKADVDRPLQSTISVTAVRQPSD